MLRLYFSGLFKHWKFLILDIVGFIDLGAKLLSFSIIPWSWLSWVLIVVGLFVASMLTFSDLYKEKIGMQERNIRIIERKKYLYDVVPILTQFNDVLDSTIQSVKYDAVDKEKLQEAENYSCSQITYYLSKYKYKDADNRTIKIKDFARAQGLRKYRIGIYDIATIDPGNIQSKLQGIRNKISDVKLARHITEYIDKLYLAYDYKLYMNYHNQVSGYATIIETNRELSDKIANISKRIEYLLTGA